MNDILKLTRGISVYGIDSRLNGCGTISHYMPQFLGTRGERMALATFIVEGLNAEKAVADTVFPG